MAGFRLPVAVVAAVLCAGVTSLSASPPLVMGAPQTDVDNLRAAAAGGDARAMYNLGLKYREGKSVPKDYAQAVLWFRKAAGSGSADAMFYLGMLHQNVGSGVPEDPAQAAVWYGKAAKLGHGAAMFYLGVLHWAGRGVSQDFVEAYKWLDLAAIYSESAEERKRAADARDSLTRASFMSPERAAEGQTQAREWRAAFERSKK